MSRALAWNTGVQILGKVISTAVGVLIASLMLRHLKQEGFGMYSTANAYLAFFAIILDLGLNVTLVHMLGERAGDKKYEDRIVSAVFSLRALTGFVLLGIAPFIALWFPYPWELKLAIFGLWLSFFTTILNQIVIGVQQRHLKTHVTAISEVLGRIVLLAGIIVARWLGWGLLPIVLLVSVGSTVNFLTNFFIARRYASFAWRFDPVLWKSILKRSWPIGVSILFTLIYYKADTLVLSFVRPQAEVGVYGAAYRVLEILVTIPFMFSGVLLPILSNMWAKGEREKFGHLLGRSLDAIALFAAPLVAGVFVLATQAMVLVGGGDFTESGNILRILIFATGLIYIGTVSAHAIVALDLQRKMLPVYITVALVTLAGYILFIPRYGMWAAAWLTLFSEFCVALASTVLTFWFSKMRWRPLVALKAVLAAVCMGVAIYPLRDMFLGIPVVVGILVYAILVFVFGAVTREMIQDILSFRRGPSPILDQPIS